MNREEIVANAKCIVYGSTQGLYVGENGKSIKEFIESGNREVLEFPVIDAEMVYTGCPVNEHHFTMETQYHWIMPRVAKMLDIPYNTNDFVLIEKKLDHYEGYNYSGPYPKLYDFSYMIPRKHTPVTIYTMKVDFAETEDGVSTTVTRGHLVYEVTSLKDVIGSYGNWNQHIFGNKLKQAGTPYHQSYKYAHWSSKIVNENAPIDKCILISGDSQVLPLIPILAYYVKTVIYLDYGWSGITNKYLWENENITDVVFAMFPLFHGIDKYANHNLF